MKNSQMGLSLLLVALSSGFAWAGGVVLPGSRIGCEQKDKALKALDPCCQKNYACYAPRAIDEGSDVIVPLNEFQLDPVVVNYKPVRIILKKSVDKKKDITALKDKEEGSLVREVLLAVRGSPTTWKCLNSVTNGVQQIFIPSNSSDPNLVFVIRDAGKNKGILTALLPSTSLGNRDKTLDQLAESSKVGKEVSIADLKLVRPVLGHDEATGQPVIDFACQGVELQNQEFYNGPTRIEGVKSFALLSDTESGSSNSRTTATFVANGKFNRMVSGRIAPMGQSIDANGYFLNSRLESDQDLLALVAMVGSKFVAKVYNNGSVEIVEMGASVGLISFADEYFKGYYFRKFTY